MNKILILLFSILISFNSYGEEIELDSSLDSYCNRLPTVKIINGLYYHPNKEKPYSGENLCVYLSNGQYYLQGEIKKGHRDGTWTYWYENGQIKTEEHWKDGVLGGILTNWNEDGSKESEQNYKNFQYDGKSIVWHENGQIDYEKNYKDGRLNGKVTFWHENGQKFFEGNYKDGKRDGKWIFWKNNRKDEERNYKDNDLVYKTIFKYSYFTGQLKSEKKYKDGKCISGDC